MRAGTARTKPAPKPLDTRPVGHPLWPAFAGFVADPVNGLHPGVATARDFERHGYLIWQTFLGGAAAGEGMKP